MASRKANPAVIGGFVLGAVALAVVAALIFSSGRLFQQTTRWVIYFDSSVKGLDIGAPVIFRGVQVGSVTDVAAYVDTTQDIVATPVYIDLVNGTVRLPTGNPSKPEATIRKWIQDRGFRAQLKSQSLVTGKLYVDLGFHPGAPLDLKGIDLSVPEIPAVPTELEQVEQTLRTVVARIAEMPLEEIVENLRSATGGAAELLSDPHLKSAVANLDGALAEVRGTFADLNGRLDGLEDDAGATLHQARATLERVEGAVTEVQSLLEPGSPLNYEILVTLDEISQTARSIRALSDALGRDPDQLIFGKGEAGEDR
jgi:paraquat-inducible protein B